MMTVTIWFSLLAICLLGAMSPGPSLAMIAKHSLGWWSYERAGRGFGHMRLA